jgi:hypothetical protein
MLFPSVTIEMNSFQQLWWQQAQSDHAVLLMLRRNGAPACHQLHYLQMITEKLGKAYFWRSGNAPPKSHAGFVQFMRVLGQARQSERQQVADAFAFKRFADFQKWIRAVLPLVYALERLAPALSHDGPNPEYPWPQAEPQHAPVEFQFDVWNQLNTGRGRQLLQLIEYAVSRFPTYV